MYLFLTKSDGMIQTIYCKKEQKTTIGFNIKGWIASRHIGRKIILHETSVNLEPVGTKTVTLGKHSSFIDHVLSKKEKKDPQIKRFKCEFIWEVTLRVVDKEES